MKKKNLINAHNNKTRNTLAMSLDIAGVSDLPSGSESERAAREFKLELIKTSKKSTFEILRMTHTPKHKLRLTLCDDVINAKFSNDAKNNFSSVYSLSVR